MLLENALDTLTIAAWVAAIGFVAIVFVRTWQAGGFEAAWHRVFSERMVLGLLIFALVVTILASTLVFIEPQQVGVVVSLAEPEGYRKQPLRSGLGLVVPLLTQVYRYPIYYQTYTMSSIPHEGQHPGDDSIAARTSDGQEVFIDLSLIYAINPDGAPHVHIAWQERYAEAFIRPLLRGVVRSQVSQFTINEVNSSMRLDLELALSEEIKMALEKHGFLMDRFLLRNIGFSTQYGLAVENKQVQEQGVFTSRYKADQARLEAQGEADALELLSAAIAQNPDVITLRYVDKLSPNIQIMLVPGNSSYFLSLPTPNALTAPGGSITPTPTPTPDGP